MSKNALPTTVMIGGGVMNFWSVGKHNWTFGDLMNVQANIYTKVL
jgi:hypothetical protein